MLKLDIWNIVWTIVNILVPVSYTHLSYTWVRVLGQQMGVGGDDSWGAPVQEIYTIPKSKVHEFKFNISPAKQRS